MIGERRYGLNFTERCYEDQLPDDMTDLDYEVWFRYSGVDGVRIGPGVTRLPEPQHSTHPKE